MTKSKRNLIFPAAIFAAALFPSCKPAPAPSESAKPPAAPAPVASSTAAPGVPAPAKATEKTPAAGASIEIKDPVATVNGEPILKAQLDEAFKAAVEASGVKSDDLSPDQKLNGYRQILDELIMDKLVGKAAAGEKVSDDELNAELAKLKKQFPSQEVFEAQLKEAGQTPEKLTTSLRTMLQQQRWMQSQVKESAPLAEADARKFYDSNTEEFKNPEQVKASHILFLVNKEDSEEVVKQKEAAAKKALEAAKKGGDFSKLAKELSEEPGAKQSGGELGFFSKDKMVPEFAEVAFSQKPGDIVGPVRTQFGWHVIKVEDRKPAGTVPFDEVKVQILDYLKNTKQREAVQGVLKSLKDSAKIESTLPPGN